MTITGFLEDYDGEEILSDIRNFKNEDEFLKKAAHYFKNTRGYEASFSEITKTKIVHDNDQWMYAMTADEEEFSGEEVNVYRVGVIGVCE